MLYHFVIVGLGGALGAMLRHAAGLAALRLIPSAFPWGTLAINVVGSLCIGIVIGLLAYAHTWSQDIRLFAVVGVLGGFTTFSSFSLETILLFERGQALYAVLYIAGSVAGSLGATLIGLYGIRALTA